MGVWKGYKKLENGSGANGNNNSQTGMLEKAERGA